MRLARTDAVPKFSLVLIACRDIGYLLGGCAMVRNVIICLLASKVALGSTAAFGAGPAITLECDAPSKTIMRNVSSDKPQPQNNSIGNRHVRIEFVSNEKAVLHYNGSNVPTVLNFIATNERYEFIEDNDNKPIRDNEYIDRIKGTYHFEQEWVMEKFVSLQIGEGPCAKVGPTGVPKF